MDRNLLYQAIKKLSDHPRVFDEEAARTVAEHFEVFPNEEKPLQLDQYMIWKRGTFIFWQESSFLKNTLVKDRILKGVLRVIDDFPRRFFLEVVNDEVKKFGSSHLCVEHSFFFTSP